MLSIKPEHKNAIIAFDKSGRVSLGNRTQESLRNLAILALESRDPSLLKLFQEPLPSLSELKFERFQSKLDNHAEKTTF